MYIWTYVQTCPHARTYTFFVRKWFNDSPHDVARFPPYQAANVSKTESYTTSWEVQGGVRCFRNWCPIQQGKSTVHGYDVIHVMVYNGSCNGLLWIITVYYGLLWFIMVHAGLEWQLQIGLWSFFKSLRKMAYETTWFIHQTGDFSRKMVSNCIPEASQWSTTYNEGFFLFCWVYSSIMHVWVHPLAFGKIMRCDNIMWQTSYAIHHPVHQRFEVLWQGSIGDGLWPWVCRTLRLSWLSRLKAPWNPSESQKNDCTSHEVTVKSQ